VRRNVLRAIGAAGVVVLGGCAGYGLQVGTSDGDLAGFQSLYSVPATSIAPWAERVRAPALPPPPTGGPSGVSTLPAARASLPPDRPASQ
jgi:multidrug efflux pump subunit AcrA (membrane-fusion protein)